MTGALPEDSALIAVLLEIERHVAAAGFDQPPRLFALVSSADLASREPALAAQLGLAAWLVVRSWAGSPPDHRLVALGLLGIGLTFAPDPLYPHYVAQGPTWGMTPAADQSVAGVIMGLEQSVLMGIALAWLFARLLGESEREEQRAERFESGPAAST